MFFESSKDILLFVLAFCVLWFTVFLCWLLYQAARVLRNANSIIENVSHKLELLVDAIEFIKNKVETMSHGMGAVSGFVATIAEKFIVGKIENSFSDRVKNKEKKTSKKTSKKKK